MCWNSYFFNRTTVFKMFFDRFFICVVTNSSDINFKIPLTRRNRSTIFTFSFLYPRVCFCINPFSFLAFFLVFIFIALILVLSFKFSFFWQREWELVQVAVSLLPRHQSSLFWAQWLVVRLPSLELQVVHHHRQNFQQLG